jgi:hypothetical protein
MFTSLRHYRKRLRWIVAGLHFKVDGPTALGSRFAWRAPLPGIQFARIDMVIFDGVARARGQSDLARTLGRPASPNSQAFRNRPGPISPREIGTGAASS